jgi:hypothetical protein
MKRLIAALSFAVLATPAFADNGKPFEQLDLDRALPNIPEAVVRPTQYPFGGSAPYEQAELDRAAPNLPVERSRVAVSDSTRSDIELSTDAVEESPWAKDHNFIAPPM